LATGTPRKLAQEELAREPMAEPLAVPWVRASALHPLRPVRKTNRGAVDAEELAEVEELDDELTEVGELDAEVEELDEAARPDEHECTSPHLDGAPAGSGRTGIAWPREQQHPGAQLRCDQIPPEPLGL
jgi:hypothetical protein